MPKGSYILMADDDKMLLDMYRERLELAGYKVTSTSNGEEALAKIRQEKPDLVMLDIMMPKADGYETLASIKSDPETKNIQVVMLSALMRDFNREKAIESGADDYLIKSEAMPSDVITKIEQVLQKYGKGLTPLPGSHEVTNSEVNSVTNNTPTQEKPSQPTPASFSPTPVPENKVDLKPLLPLNEIPKAGVIETTPPIKPLEKTEEQTVSFEPAQQETIAKSVNPIPVQNNNYIETQPETPISPVPTVSMNMVQPQEEPPPAKPKTSLFLIVILTILITAFINDIIMFLLFFMQK